jgi:hypothetical protein
VLFIAAGYLKPLARARFFFLRSRHDFQAIGQNPSSRAGSKKVALT